MVNCAILKSTLCVLLHRVLLGRPLRTEAERDINFILVPEELAHLWRDCELCCMAARILCPECKQVRAGSAVCARVLQIAAADVRPRLK